MQKSILIGVGALFLVAASGVHADPVKARQNYDRFCAACHGFNGVSVSPDAPNLRFNQGLLQSDLQIVQKLKMGSSKKPPMVGILSDQDLQQVVIFARTLR